MADSHHPAVTYLDGAAERIPLADDSCDLVLLFLVWHHVREPATAAVEIDRVLRPGGRVIVRSTFSDRMPDMVWHRYFPRARDVEIEIFPTADEVASVFSDAGLRRLAFDQVHVQTWSDLAQYAERLRLRAISTFEYLSEEEVSEGFARLDADVAAGVEQGPLEEGADVLVLGRPD